jgi:hypothetical protein
LDLDVSKFPEPVQKILNAAKVKGALAAPAAFRKAEDWVWNKQGEMMQSYIIPFKIYINVIMLSSKQRSMCLRV